MDKYIPDLIAMLLIAIIVTILISSPFESEQEVSNISTFQERCAFYKKVTFGNATISENEAGTFHYEMYQEGSSTIVYKCKK